MDETKTTFSQFALEVIRGFTANPKSVSSKYFYDATGDSIFQQIMHMPEYYLTRAEHEIFSTQYKEICESAGIVDQPFNLVELGAGDGYKTKILLQYLQEKNSEFTYMPVDISENILDELVLSLKGMFPYLDVEPLNYEYFEALTKLPGLTNRHNVIFFLGSNIGNFHLGEAQNFLRKIAQSGNSGDNLLLGVDLKKDPEIIRLAYDDPQGITRDFNLNLLHRMNRELGANFVIDNFKHVAVYDEPSGEMLSFLESKKDQEVEFEAIEEVFFLTKGERIHTEVSKKYSKEEIRNLAASSGFEVVKFFVDQHNYFTNALLVNVKGN